MQNKNKIFYALGGLAIVGAIVIGAMKYGNTSSFKGALTQRINITKDKDQGARNQIMKFEPKTWPQVSLSPLLAAGSLPGSVRTTVFAFNISAGGSQPGQGFVHFKKANGNKIIVTLSGAKSGVSIASASGPKFVCVLTDGNNDYSSLEGGAGKEVFAFDFDLKDLSIPVGSVQTLKVECDTTAFVGGNSTIKARLDSKPTTIQWSDGFSANIDKKLVIAQNIVGPPFWGIGSGESGPNDNSPVIDVPKNVTPQWTFHGAPVGPAGGFNLPDGMKKIFAFTVALYGSPEPLPLQSVGIDFSGTQAGSGNFSFPCELYNANTQIGGSVQVSGTNHQAKVLFANGNSPVATVVPNTPITFNLQCNLAGFTTAGDHLAARVQSAGDLTYFWNGNLLSGNNSTIFSQGGWPVWGPNFNN